MEIPSASPSAGYSRSAYTDSKWQRIYYVLAAFVVISISASFFFSHTLTNKYQQSVAENEYWNIRLNELSELGVLALRVNSPGNNVFETGNLAEERAALATAAKSFDEAVLKIRANYRESTTLEIDPRAKNLLNSIERLHSSVLQNSNQVFNSLEKGLRAEASTYMAKMDRSSSQTISAIEELRLLARNSQAEQLQIQEEQAIQLSRYELALGGFIALMVCAVLVYGRKISEHMIETNRRAEEASVALAKNEARHRSIINNAMDASVLLDNKGNIVEWSHHAERIFRSPRENTLGQNFVGIFIEEDLREIYERAFNNMLSEKSGSESGKRLEAKVVRGNGEKFPVEISAATITSEGKPWLNLFVRDITERILAEKELTRAKDEAEYALHELSTQKFALDQHAIVAVTDPEGTIKYANGKFCAISKYRKEELIGQNHRIVNSGYHPKEFFQEMYRVLNSGNVWHGEIKNKAKDGTTYWVKSTIVPYRNFRGKIERFIAIREDITERKAAEEEIIKAKEAAEKANNAKSEFLATMSHEIRTPMNGVIGFANLLIDTPLSQEQSNFARTIKNSGEALLSIINDILDFSKIEAGKMEIEYMPFDLRETAEEAVELLSSRAQNHGIELCLRFDASVPRGIMADPGRVRQIIVNLAGNAIKFTEKGHVLIEVEPLENQEDDFIRISVTDTGIGIPADKQGLLFGKFSQADSSTARKFGGTGLGLAISKLLCEMMGGSIGFESEVGKGSTFWFTLPMPKSRVELPECEIEPDIRDHSILVVDDYPLNRQLLSEHLSQWGTQFDTAKSGVEALGKLKSAAKAGKPYEVAIMDYCQPEMDGESLGRKILNDDAINSTKLIMLTSGGSREDSRRFLNAGFSEYMLKPLVRPNLLRRAIARCIGLIDTNERNSAYSDSQTTNESEQLGPEGAYRALVVDDNQTNQLLLKQLMLRKFQYRVDLAANGKEAIEMVKQFPYDLIIMDCMMPIMDGFEATAAIRELEAQNEKAYPGIDPKRRIPIIALTANAMKGDREKCLLSGMDDYLSKPVNIERLSTSLNELLGNHRPISEDPAGEKSGWNSVEEHPIFDPSILTAFFPDEPKTVSTMLETFLEGMREQLANMREVLDEACDIESIRFHAHRIKGSASEFGAHHLCEVADRIETACREDRLQSALILKEDFFETAEKTIEAVVNHQSQ